MLPPGLAGGPPAPGGHANPQQVALIMRLMHGAGQSPAAAAGPARQNGQGMSSLQIAQSLIQDLHDAMRQEGDPQIVNVYATCLKAVTGVQQQLMSQQGGK